MSHVKYMKDIDEFYNTTIGESRESRAGRGTAAAASHSHILPTMHRRFSTLPPSFRFVALRFVLPVLAGELPAEIGELL